MWSLSLSKGKKMTTLRAASSLCEVGGAGRGLRLIPFDRLRDHVMFSLYALRQAQGPCYVFSLFPSTSSGTILFSLLTSLDKLRDHFRFTLHYPSTSSRSITLCHMLSAPSALCPMHFPLRQARGPWLRPRAKLKTSKYCRRGNPYPSISVLSTPKCDC